MALNKLKKWKMIYFSSIIIAALYTIITGFFLNEGGVTSFSFLDNIIWDIGIYSIFYALSPFIGYYFAYTFSPIFLRIYVARFKSIQNFYIENVTRPKDWKLDFKRLIYPALFSLNTGLIISEISSVRQLILTPTMFESGTFMTQILVLMPVLAITSIVANILFASLYFLMDSGIISTNIDKMKDSSHNTDIHNIGSKILSI